MIFRTVPITTLFAFTLFCSCTHKETMNSEPVPLARVYDVLLYSSDIPRGVKSNLTKEDSSVFTRDFIDDWINKTLVIHRAETELADDPEWAEIERKTDEYRTALIVYSYRNRLLGQLLDTAVSDIEVKEYSKTNLSDSILRDSVSMDQNINFVKHLILKERQKNIIEKATELLHEDALEKNAIEIY